MEWISVNDPPKTSRKVLICEDDDVQTGFYSLLRKKWVSLEDRGEDVTPTYWMPLPEPPKEDA